VNRRTLLLSLILLVLLTPMAHAQRTDDRLPSPMGIRAVGGGAPARTTIQDGGFESSYEAGGYYINDAWKADSSVFGSPICIADGCGQELDFGGPHEGDSWVYFGGTNNAETGFIQQKLVIPDTGDVHLSYFVWHPFAGVTPTLTVTIDSVVVDTLPGVNAGYVERFVDLSAFADGRTHKLRFSYSKPNGGYADVNIDSLALYKGDDLSPFGAGFESDTEFWTVKNGTGDKVVCSKPGKVFGFSGDCAFRFKGGPGENSKLKQSYAFLRGLPSEAGRAPANFAFYVGAFVNAPPSVQGMLTLKLTLSDESVVKRKVPLVGKGKYKWIQTPAVQYSSELGIIAILIGFKHTSAGGKAYIDDVEAFRAADYS
jgi:hypothetical protein